MARFQRSDDMVSFDLLETRHGLETRHRNIALSVCVEGFQLGGWGAQYGVRRKNDGSLDEVLQFPDVSGPGVSHQRIHCLRRDFIDSLVHSPGIELREMPNQRWNVLRTFPQRGNVDRKYFQSVIQVFAKCR